MTEQQANAARLPDPIPPRSGAAWIELARQFAEQYAIYIVLAVVILVGGLLSPVFLSGRNINNMFRAVAPLGVAAVGQTFVILTGGIDLSVASVMALMSVLAANLMDGSNERVLPITLLCLAVALLIGLLNGLLVTRLKIPPFIATLGMTLIVQGIRFVYTGGAPKGSIPDDLRFWGRGAIIEGIPTAIVVMLVIAVGAVVLLQRTVFGRKLYALGGNATTAFLSGIHVDRITVAAYMICSFLAGVAGLLLTGYIGLADNWLGRGFELDSIAATVVGGTLLSGGRGGIAGTIAGVLLITILFNLVLLLRLDEETQRIVKGIVIIAAVALYMRLHSRGK